MLNFSDSIHSYFLCYNEFLKNFEFIRNKYTEKLSYIKINIIIAIIEISTEEICPAIIPFECSINVRRQSCPDRQRLGVSWVNMTDCIPPVLVS